MLISLDCPYCHHRDTYNLVINKNSVIHCSKCNENMKVYVLNKRYRTAKLDMKEHENDITFDFGSLFNNVLHSHNIFNLKDLKDRYNELPSLKGIGPKRMEIIDKFLGK